MQKISDWERERLARADATDSLRHAWRVEADHKREWARRTAGMEDALYLQVHEKDGMWYEPAPVGYRSRVNFTARLDLASTQAVVDRARDVLRFLANIESLASWVAEQFTHKRPPLRLVD
jgi:hypothetical protein